MPTDHPTPRRKWHLKRWFIVFFVALFAWCGWRVVDHRSAIKEARALGWDVRYTDPSEAIRANWKNAFRKATWTDGVMWVSIPTNEAFEPHLAVVHRLNPRGLEITDGATLRDLSAIGSLTKLHFLWLEGCTGLTNVDVLKNLPALKAVWLMGCTRLTNVDALKDLSALQEVFLNDSTGLTNVDALKNLPVLERVMLTGCTGLTPESVLALKTAQPKAVIHEH